MVVFVVMMMLMMVWVVRVILWLKKVVFDDVELRTCVVDVVDGAG